MPTPIKLISLDIDGTLYGPKGSAFDMKRIAEFRVLAKKLRARGIIPIICTGKHSSYVEAFAEAYGLIGSGASHVCEHGAEIFVYDAWKTRSYTDLGAYAAKDYSELHKVAGAITKQTGTWKEDKQRAIAIIAKEVNEELFSRTLSIIRSLGYSVQTAPDSATIKEFFSLLVQGKREDEIRAATQRYGADFYASLSPMAINLTAFPLTKAFGLAYAAAKIHKCGLENVVAIGDDYGDMPLFDVVGMPIAVANADGKTKSFVKEKSGIITKKKSLEGVIDVMKLILKCRTTEELRKV